MADTTRLACAYCGQLIACRVSDDFCEPWCQRAWHAARSAGEVAASGCGPSLDSQKYLSAVHWSRPLSTEALHYTPEVLSWLDPHEDVSRWAW